MYGNLYLMLQYKSFARLRLSTDSYIRLRLESRERDGHDIYTVWMLMAQQRLREELNIPSTENIEFYL